MWRRKRTICPRNPAADGGAGRGGFSGVVGAGTVAGAAGEVSGRNTAGYGGVLPWYAGAMIPLALANVLVNDLLARLRFNLVPPLLLLAAGLASP